MKSSILAIAAAACVAAVPASAQVLGGDVGVGAGTQVGLPPTQPLTGTVGQTIRDAGQTARETTTDVGATTRDAVDATLNAQVTTSGDASVQAEPGQAERGQASADLDLSAGAMVHGADGAMLGTLVGTTRDTAGRIQGFAVRSADGTVKAVPATGAQVQGDVLVTGWSEAQFRAAPAAD